MKYIAHLFFLFLGVIIGFGVTKLLTPEQIPLILIEDCGQQQQTPFKTPNEEPLKFKGPEKLI